MTIPLQFASLYDRQEIFVLSNCLLDLGTDFLVGKSAGLIERLRVRIPAGILLQSQFSSPEFVR